MRYSFATIAIVSIVLLMPVSPRARASEPELERTKILLDIEPLLIDSRGIHPMGAPVLVNPPIEEGSAETGWINLGADDTNRVQYTVNYCRRRGDPFCGEAQPNQEGKIRVRLERKLLRGESEEKLAPLDHEMEPTDVWTATLLKDTGRGGRLDLRLVPIIGSETSDEPFGKQLMELRLQGGPLLQFNKSGPDRVIFDGLGVGGKAIFMGIPGVGVVTLAAEPFPGAKECGWVRGHVMSFSFGDLKFKAWSAVQILPEDRNRPGKGWTIFGVLKPNVSERGFYGGGPELPH
jgi:hypothetical protein